MELSATTDVKKELFPLTKPLAYPPAFLSGKGSHLVMPVNEGISYPVDDESLPADALLSLRRPRAVHGVVRRDRRRARA